MFMFNSIKAAPDQPENADYIGSEKRNSKRWLAMVAILITVVAAWLLLSSAKAPAPAPPLPVVGVSAPLQRQITQWDEFIGRFEASRAVDVRPRVSGQITAIHFTDGQFVRQGAPLFTIDSRSYRAALSEAQASVATASASLNLARSNLSRAQRLISDDAVAKTEIDRLVAEVRASEAALASAQAQVLSRSLDVQFSTVRAPISGRISDRRVDAGNLVGGGNGDSATLLTTINALDPIHFTFDGSEALFLKAKREGLDRGAPVDVRLQDESEYGWHGKLDFTDNALDSRSGTIRARAVIDNPQQFLTPGMFGNMRLQTGAKIDALLVPDTAVQTDQTRKILLVVGKGGKVVAKQVELGALVGGLRRILKGVTASDRIVIEGTQMAMPGTKVRARNQRIAAPEKEAPSRQALSSPAGQATLSNPSL